MGFKTVDPAPTFADFIPKYYHDSRKQNELLVPAESIQHNTWVENPPISHRIGGSVRPGLFYRVGNLKMSPIRLI